MKDNVNACFVLCYFHYIRLRMQSIVFELQFDAEDCRRKKKW